MSKLVHNEKLDYYVDVTAGLWRDAFREYTERVATREPVSLIIGVDGKPLVIPNELTLHDGEWVVSVCWLTDAMKWVNMRRDVTVDPGKITIDGMSDDTLERTLFYLSVRGRGIAIPTATFAKRDCGCYGTHRAALDARYRYDIVHNIQYLIDNFGYSANRQKDE